MERRDLRQKMLEIRKSLPSNVVKKVSKEICDVVKNLDSFKNAKKIASYMAYNGEIDPSFLESSNSKTFAFPVVQENGLLKFMQPIGTLRKGSFGISEPEIGIEEEISELDLVLVPLVAADYTGNRLGHGVGYYDRTFATDRISKRPLLVGLAYDFQIVEKLVTNSWDIPLDVLVTESRLFFSEMSRSRVSMGEY